MKNAGLYSNKEKLKKTQEASDYYSEDISKKVGYINYGIIISFYAFYEKNLIKNNISIEIAIFLSTISMFLDFSQSLFGYCENRHAFRHHEKK